MFTGLFYQKLDSKGRVVVPGKFRALLGEVFVITKSLDGCLSIYEKNSWALMEEKLNSLPYTDHRARTLKRFLLGASEELTVDKQGRILIPQALRIESKLDVDLVFLGVGDHIEVWDKNAYDNNDIFKDNDRLAESMEGLGI